MTTPERILVVGPAWVGDMVMAQSLFITLRREHPGVEIDVLAPAWSAPLLARMPEVHEAVSLPVAHGELALRERWATGRRLRARRYDQAIVIPRSLKAALTPYFAHIPRRTGYRGEWRYGLLNDIRPLDKQRLPRTVQRYVALGGPAQAALPPVTPPPRLRIDEANRARQMERLGLAASAAAIAMMPGAEYGPAKRWPAQYFAETATAMIDAGYQVWLLGSDKDRSVAAEIAAVCPRGVVNLCGATRLEDVVDLLSAVRAAVTNDSGLMHVAAAVGTPLVAIYGSSTPAYTPPLTERARVLYLGLPCSPCFQRVCPLGHTNCLRDQTPATVVQALRGLLGNEQA